MSAHGIVAVGWAIYRWGMGMLPYTSFIRHQLDRLLGLFAQR